MANTTSNVFFGTVIVPIVLLVVLLSATLGANLAHAAITSSLDVGSTGTQVRELQTYLATNASIYPQGLVTGYFGALTQAAVQRFQAAQGLVSSGTPATTGYGRVGPITMARLNSLMGSAPVVSSGTWDTVPILSGVSTLVSLNSVTFTWYSNEPTQGQLYWSPSLIQADEATGPGQIPYVSGTQASSGAGYLTTHNVTVSGLQPNTIYHYLIRGIDAGGNISIIWPSSVRTNN